MSDLIEPKVANQLPVAPLPLLGTDLIVVSRDGVNLLQSTLNQLIDRTNHTGSQLAETISDLETTVLNIVGDDIAARPETELAVTASRNAALTDVARVITSNETLAVTITIQNASLVNFPDGTVLACYQANTGALTFAAGAGVTFEGVAPTPTQYFHMCIRKRTGDVWAWI